MELKNFPRYPFLLYVSYFLYSYMAFQVFQNGADFYLSDFFGETAADKELSLWFLMSVCTTIGYLIISRKSFQNIKFYSLIIAINILILPLYKIYPQLFLPILIVTMINMGFLCSIAHYIAALSVNNELFGRFIGIALSCAIFFQYLMQNLDSTLTMCILMIVIGILQRHCLKNINHSTEENKLKVDNKSIVKIIILVVTISMLLGLSDGVEFKISEGDVNISFESVRLIYAVGIIFAGWIADLNHRKYLLPATIIMATARIIGLNIFTFTENYILHLAINYLCGSLIIITITILFLNIAPKAENPMFWAGMGRAIQLPISSFSAIIGGNLWENFSWNAFVILYVIVLLIPLTLITFKTLNINFDSEVQEVQSIIPNLQPEIIKIEEENHFNKTDSQSSELQEKFNFTKRELDIIDGILAGQNIKEMAIEMNIKERTVKYHISNILRKTNTKNQRELVILLSYQDNFKFNNNSI